MQLEDKRAMHSYFSLKKNCLIITVNHSTVVSAIDTHILIIYTKAKLHESKK